MGGLGENNLLLKTEKNILTVSFIEGFLLGPMEPFGGFLSP
jgi:hypothetical protein